MASVQPEYQRFEQALKEFDGAGTDREALRGALLAMGQIMMDVLEELRELREQVGNA